MPDKNNPETSVHNKNPDGPDKKYDMIDKALYDCIFYLNTKFPELQKYNESNLQNDSVTRFMTYDVSEDAIYDAGVHNRKKEAAKTKSPSK